MKKSIFAMAVAALIPVHFAFAAHGPVFPDPDTGPEPVPAGIPVYTCKLLVNGTQAGMSGSLIADDRHVQAGTYLGLNQNQDGLHENRFTAEAIAAPTGGRTNLLLRIKDNGEYTSGIQEGLVGQSPIVADYVAPDGQRAELLCTLTRI
jgi:hypothetical protein